jgi:hypothetical protein
LQAEQTRDRSPLYSRLCEQFATDPRVAAIIESPPRWDAPLRLLSALHYLVLEGKASWESPGDALTDHAGFLRRYVAEQAVQTNEVQRCWMLLPCFLQVAEWHGATTLDVIELGTSAGLNLNWDSHHYTYGAGEWGPPDATLRLTGDERRSIPRRLLDLRPRVRDRVGIDRDPIDVTTDAGARLLKSFVWADQTARLARLDEAIAATRLRPPKLLRGDLVDLLPGLLDSRKPDALTIVWQTAVLGYLPDDRRAAVYDTLARAGDAGPLAFVATSAANDGSQLYYGLTVQSWPGGERRQLAHADFHGAWVDWLDAAERDRRADTFPGV